MAGSNMKPTARALDVLLRLSIFGGSCGVGMMVALVLFLCGMPAGMVFVVMMVAGLIGVAIGHRATRPSSFG